MPIPALRSGLRRQNRETAEPLGVVAGDQQMGIPGNYASGPGYFEYLIEAFETLEPRYLSK